MKKLTHNEIRNLWRSFFEAKGHAYFESAPLVPIDDDSLLWINAGVTPLKKFFDGSVVPESKRIVNIQKCIRTNDIENVGVTKRHHTFFEMMGNFSIGDYFKKEAISFAFELLTSDEWFAIPLEKLYVTVYTHDEEAYNYWKELGFIEDHIVKLEGNFWEIGEGPCGPDSEIFFDRGEKYDQDGTALEKFKQDDEQERFVEIWNNVFSQFNSKEGVPREKYKELPHKNIDTGAGLERWCTIFQDVDSSFETDLFRPIMEHLENMTGILYDGQTAFKVIADHIKAITFALSDGALFENVGRGYVLRRLLRRSVRFGKQLGFKEPFLYKLVSTVVNLMKDAYPYLVEKQVLVETLVLEEEKLFLKTLEAGEKRLLELTKESKDGKISGNDAFKLYDTYGFPFELTEEYLTELGFTTSRLEFDKYMEEARQTAKKNARTKTQMASQKKVLLDFKKESTFVYGLYRLKSSILAIVSKDALEKKLDHDGYIILKRTCFYSESGGQVSDTGMIIGKNFKARVVDVFKGPNGQHIHKVRLLDGVITTGDDCEAIIDKDRRRAIEANHSAVHMLHYALQDVISKDIRQAGSYVDDMRLRLDFTYAGKMTDEKILAVEQKVNDQINASSIVSTEVMPLDKAKELGAMALFTEKYGSTVRVVKMGKSIELCGGTHLNNTKDAVRFAIFSCESKGSNVYRIEAVTKDRIESALFDVIKPYNDEMMKLLMKAKEIIEMAHKEGIVLSFDVDIDHSKPTSYKDIIFNQNELSYVQTEVKTLEKQYFEAREKKKLEEVSTYLQKQEIIDEIPLLYLDFEEEDMALLKSLADALCNQLSNGVVFLINHRSDRSINLICRSASKEVNAGFLIKQASQLLDGNGGGSMTFAQGGGKTDASLDQVRELVLDTLRKDVI